MRQGVSFTLEICKNGNYLWIMYSYEFFSELKSFTDRVICSLFYDYLFDRNCIKFNYSSNVKVERKKKDFYLAYTLEQETQIYRRKGSSSETFNLLSGHDAIWLFPSCCKISLSWFIANDFTVYSVRHICRSSESSFDEATLEKTGVWMLLSKPITEQFEILLLWII